MDNTSAIGKRRKACDMCKRRKIRCDSAQMPGNRCSHCVQLGCECTHKAVTRALGPKKGYIENLESRLKKMENLLVKLLPPGADVTQEIEQGTMEMEGAVEIPKPAPEAEQNSLPRNDDDEPGFTLSMLFRKEPRFYGKSSGLRLLQTALEVKENRAGESTTLSPSHVVNRLEFWEHPTWAAHEPEEEDPHYIFPDEDLEPYLIDAYFKQINPFFPVLHRPIFQRLVDAGLHRADPMFGAVYLLVCAHGARFSEDPRVLADGTDSPRSAGWRWYEQIDIHRRSYVEKATLYELQRVALYVMFGLTTESPQACWTILGAGIRLAQDIGAHRKRGRDFESPSAENELWKRAFWVILSMERTVCSFIGRSCSLQGEDLDVDLPIECDDEYWECGFEQPADKPSTIAYFIRYLELMDILAHATRTLYSIKHSNYRFARFSKRPDHELVSELDSTMNEWMDSVPSHLKWNPKCENQLSLRQSAALHAFYYYLQIYIHRPFVPSPRNPLPGIFPSLAICNNAARSCCHVLEVLAKPNFLALAHLQVASFMSAVILLLNIWSGRHSGYAPNPLRNMEDVQRCLAILKASERRCASAGRLCDILTELASAGEVSIKEKDIPNSSGRQQQREAWNDTVENETFSVPQASNHHSETGNHEPALNLDGLSEQVLQQPACFPLPMYSNELGRLPIYGQHTFLDSAFPSQKINPGASQHLSSSSSSSLFQQESLSRGSQDTSFPESFPSQNNGPSQLPWAIESFTNPNDVGDFSPSMLNPTVPPEMYAQDVSAMDIDVLNMWLTAPTNLEWEDWNTYISAMDQVTQGRS